MGFYGHVVVPLLCDFGWGRPFVARYRRELLAHAGGGIVEIGFGTGLNLPYRRRLAGRQLAAFLTRPARRRYSSGSGVGEPRRLPTKEVHQSILPQAETGNLWAERTSAHTALGGSASSGGLPPQHTR